MRAEAPHAILRRSMAESAKLSKDIRRILARQIEAAEKAMDDPLVTDTTKSALLEHILSILAALEKSVESSGRLLLTKSTKSETTEAPKKSTEDIMAEITKGKKAS